MKQNVLISVIFTGTIQQSSWHRKVMRLYGLEQVRQHQIRNMVRKEMWVIAVHVGIIILG